MNRINLLWFDDDLRPFSDGHTEERTRLQTWLRYFHTGDRRQRISLIEVRDLPTLRRELQRRHDKPEDDPEHIDVFLIDVLWRASDGEHNWRFADLDPVFKDERVLPLDAGAQLIGLMCNQRYKTVRPGWMKAFEQHPFAALTSLVDYHGTVEKHVDQPVQCGMTILVKGATRDGEHDPDHDFCQWVASLKKRNSARPAAAGKPA